MAFLTSLLIGSHYEMTNFLANHDNAFKMFHYTLAHDASIFHTPSMIGLINDGIFLLTNQQVVLIIVISVAQLSHSQFGLRPVLLVFTNLRFWMPDLTLHANVQNLATVF